MYGGGDGALNCTANNVKWARPVTVWRGQTFQAETAQYTAGSSAAPRDCSPTTKCGGGKRVSWNRAGNGLVLNGVKAASGGSNNIIVYYTNGDPVGSPLRTLSVSVNGGAPQYKNFEATRTDWDTVASTTISLSGFNTGTNNTVTFTGASGNQAPDLDWFEVIGSTAAVASPGACSRVPEQRLVRPQVGRHREVRLGHAEHRRLAFSLVRGVLRSRRGAADDEDAGARSALRGRSGPPTLGAFMAAKSPSSSIKLKPADPFDLIRWLARSQSDPRKAVAELVQNSLDADARRVTIERRRVRRAPALVIRDDGEGIVPGLSREDALRVIATNIGHSRKRGLSPRQRHDEIVAGKYGIGLLGFWSIGRRMDIRSRVGGGDVWVLRMIEDQERADLLRDRMAFDTAETFTEIVIGELHESAQRILSGRRLNDYLSSELRGMLLATGATLEIHDGLARGLAERTFVVVPRRFVGERLAVPETAPVEGYATAKIELYLARGDDRAAIEVSCAGTLVADDVVALGVAGLDRSPWTGRGLTGLIEFPAFQVPPGTRRGVVPDAASEAFGRAMAAYAPFVETELGRLERERQATTSRQLLGELRRALRGLRARLPQYELPKVEEGSPEAGMATNGPPGGAAPEGLAVPVDDRDADEDHTSTTAEEERPSLFPPGPLAEVRILPAKIVVQAGRERRVQAIALDRDGRRMSGDVTFSWSSDNAAVTLVGAGMRPLVRAKADARPGLHAAIAVVATREASRAEASAPVLIADRPESPTDLAAGVPEPELVDDSGGRWRSRFDGQRWQVNASHDDYIALRAEPRTRLRYLLALFAKEVALRAHGVPGSESALESLVEILAHAERNLGG